ncbi:sigma factor [Mycobacterium sp. 852013-50091_SCH5140682]|uniref:sigma factor n=1 Tax=Mycobacterium sp. 852013-50091_SCH5140682 TaxID=1834109 RepID=UPI0025702806|nr:sigma factor [Mycobacterium sp. 852013-50091_SCH5140682]
MTLNDFDADDLVQDAMLNAYKSFHTFKHATNLQPDLGICCEMAVKDCARRKLAAGSRSGRWRHSGESLCARGDHDRSRLAKTQRATLGWPRRRA